MNKTVMETVFLLECLCESKHLLIQVSWESFLVDVRTVVLPYFQPDKFFCHMNAGRTQEAPRSVMRDGLFLQELQ